MALSRRDKIRLKTQVIDELGSPKWSWDQTNVLLHEFGLDGLVEDRLGPSLADSITTAPESLLLELYAVVMGVDMEEVESDVAAAAEDGKWQRGYVRLFISHSATHKAEVGKMATELAVMGIHGFVAHDAMEVSRPWQLQIEQALRTMQAFVAIVRPEFNDSPWCQGEVGWALGRRVPRFAVRMGADPAGFLGRDQWPSCVSMSPKRVAGVIAEWVLQLPELGATVFDGMLEALRTAGNYMDAGATAERIGSLGSLTDDQLERISAVWWTNDQLHGGVLPTRAMRVVFTANGRSWPPPKPARSVSPSSPPGTHEDEPF